MGDAAYPNCDREFAFILAYVVLGWIFGILLTNRVETLPKDNHPPWRILCRVGWILIAVGWAGPAIVLVMGLVGLSNGMDPILLLMFGLTFVSPLLWIIGWIDSRKPQSLSAPRRAEKPKPQGDDWPPPPNDSQDAGS